MVTKTVLTEPIDAPRSAVGAAPPTAPVELVRIEPRPAGGVPSAGARERARLLIRRGYEALIGRSGETSDAALDRHAGCMRAALRNNHPSLAEWHRQRLVELGADPSLIDSIGRRRIAPSVPPRLAAVLSYADLLSDGCEGNILAHASAMAAVGIGPGELAELTRLVALVSYRAHFLSDLDQDGDLP